MTINEMIERLQLLKTLMRVPGDTGIAIFSDSGNDPELMIHSIEVEGNARPYIAINCETA